jgi:hypothetical protein
VGALPFLLWVAEISLWAAAPYWVLLLNGAFAGFWAGLFLRSIWPELLHISSVVRIFARRAKIRTTKRRKRTAIVRWRGIISKGR